MLNEKDCKVDDTTSDEDAKPGGSDSQNACGFMPSLKNEKSTKEQSAPVTSTSAPSDASQRIFFPLRLHDIVSDESTNDIIKWLPRVNAFMIVDKRRFASEILPRSFPQSCQFTSFTRKLGRWRFHRVPRGPLIGAYHHDLFVQGDREKCYLMTCKGVSLPSQPTFAAGSASMPGMPSLPINPVGVLAIPAHTTAESSQSNSVSSISNDQSSSTSATPGISPQLSSLAATNSSTSAPEMNSLVQNVPPTFRKAFEDGVQQLAQLDQLIQALQQKLGAEQVAQQARDVQLVQAKERVDAARLAVLNQMSVEHMSTEDASIALSNALEQHITSTFGGNSQNFIGNNSLGSYQQNGSGINHPSNGNGH